MKEDAKVGGLGLENAVSSLGVASNDDPDGVAATPLWAAAINRQFARQIGTLQMALLMPSAIDHIEKLFQKVQQEIGFRSGCVGTREFGLKGNFHLAKYAPVEAKYAPVEQSFRR